MRKEPQLEAREVQTVPASLKNFFSATAPEGCGMWRFQRESAASLVSSNVI